MRRLSALSSRSGSRLAASFALVLAAGLALGAAGCDDKKKSEPAPTPSASVTPTTVSDAATTMAGDAAATADAGMAMGDAGTTDGHMSNCPSAATGATVALKDVEGGIEISITGKDDAAAKEIKARMVKLVESDKNEVDAGVKHDHSGSGHGIYGRCTIVMRNTKLTTADLPNGVKATVLANNKTEVDWLRRETRERDKDAAMAGSAGAGIHKMAHCPSAVEGAKTTVKDSKEGVVVTVTAPPGAADKVKDIRDRAKHTADVAKMGEPPKVEHNSEGKGGGGLGRCPIVVEGDTTVDVKDVDNGSEITVKAKKDVVGLQKEAKLRAGNFGAK
ncbi:MAG: hypothetical protein QOI41_433 [Myxococcales bacterium]|nr:hypothetical protein [Myxococcales bacterium]